MKLGPCSIRAVPEQASISLCLVLSSPCLHPLLTVYYNICILIQIRVISHDCDWGRLYVFACLLLRHTKRPHAEENCNISLTLASHRSQSTSCHIPSNLGRVLRIFFSERSCCNSRYYNAFKALSTSTVSCLISSPPSSTVVSAGSFGRNMFLASKVS